MPEYQMTWITSGLAVGYAPMSYAELDSIRAQGINAIVNLCGEFCDLHEIEEQGGFEVYFLPIPDENAPDMEEMEQALEWLDEALYLGKKVLVHCRHGIGRTGTFVSAYLLRRGLGLKVAEKTLKHTRANPTNYSQWRLLKKYGRKSGTLTVREPVLESRHVVDLAGFFAEYEALVREVDESIAESSGRSEKKSPHCGRENMDCCTRYFEMKLIEAIYLTNKMNSTLPAAVRLATVHRAAASAAKLRSIVRNGPDRDSHKGIGWAYSRGGIVCPLNVSGECLLYEYRPLRCRCHGQGRAETDGLMTEDVLSAISRNVFLALSGLFPGREELLFNCHDTVSGRFVQIYFHYLARLAGKTGRAQKI